MKKLLEELCLIPGISGREEAVRDAILQKAAPYCQCTVDPLGSLICVKKGKRTPKQKILLSAHMDEVGFVVTHITEDGFLKCAAVGGVDPRVVFGKQVSVNGIPGVVAGKAVHQLKNDEKDNMAGLDDMFIDIGASDRQQAEQQVSLFDPVCFVSDFVSFGDGMIKCKAIDDRAGCAILLDIMARDLPYDVTFSFVTQEEVGLRGAKAAAFAVEPDIAFVVEATTAADIGGVPEDKQVCHVGQGTVVSFMDSRTIYDKDLYDRAFAISRAKGIPCQTKAAVAGGNDAGAIHLSRGGVRTLALSLPCRYLHSPVCVIGEKDMTATRDLLLALVEEAEQL